MSGGTTWMASTRNGRRGAKIIEAPELTAYPCYEMVVEDKFGFHRCFPVDRSSPMKFRWPACAKIGVPRMPYGAKTQ
jgi:hypothetical protein